MEDEAGVEMDLYTACSLGDEDFVVQYLKTGRVDVDAANCVGWTPLMYAAWGGHRHVVLHLLNTGANKQRLNNQLQTALHLAAKTGCLHTAKLVFQENIMDLTDSDKKTALFYSVEFGFLDTTSFLLQKGSNVNISCGKRSVLMVAAENGHGPLVELLLSHGADREAVDEQGLTARQLAVQQGHLYLAPLLEPSKQDHNIRAFLASISMEKYWPVLEIQKMSFEVFLNLNEQDLKAIGIKLLGPRRKIFMALTAYKRLNLGKEKL